MTRTGGTPASERPPLLQRIRDASRAVMDRARLVRIEPRGLGALAGRLAAAPPPPDPDPAHRPLGSDADTAAFVLTLDTINFGSGWFPHLRKRPGCSGYQTLAAALEERFQEQGPWSARDLTRLTPEGVARTLGQEPRHPEVGELMERFARALRELGDTLLREYAGRFEGPLEHAGGRAERLVEILAGLASFQDVSRYEELEVPFFKRAQITASDLARAFDGRGLGAFQDLDQLTAFADNLVPHVLRLEGALVYAPALLERIRAGELLVAGSAEEVEIRAAAVHAVELLVAAVRERGGSASAQALDAVLWTRGQRPEMKAHPRHRARSWFY